jgi:hypothetical protein
MKAPETPEVKEAKDKKKEPETIMLNSGDDLMSRAEKIVRVMGFRGAVGGYTLDIYRMLQKYEKLDNDEANARAEADEIDEDRPGRILKELREAISCCCSEHRYKEVSDLITELEIILVISND